MHVAALFHGGNAFADVMAVLDDRVALGDLGERNFVADGYVMQTFHTKRLIAPHQPAGQHLALADAFDDNDADGILFFVYEIMRCSHLVLLKKVRIESLGSKYDFC